MPRRRNPSQSIVDSINRRATGRMVTLDNGLRVRTYSNEDITRITDNTYRGRVSNMPTRRRTNDLTGTTATRSSGTPRRVSVEEYNANPKRFKNAIPIQGTQEGRTIMYVAEEAGNGK